LAVLVDRQDDGMSRRLEVETDDVAQRHELRIIGQQTGASGAAAGRGYARYAAWR
jgi:hypothetical protein